MRGLQWARRPMLEAVDWYYSMRPQSLPSEQSLEQCKIVSHRGEHDNRGVLENTFKAYDPLVEHQVWGLECDVRWTKDLVPVVLHDADLLRLFGKRLRLSDLNAVQLRKECPEIPFLEALIQRYGAKIHLMVELKDEHYPRPDYQREVLMGLFAGLQAKRDYHFISLQPELFKYVDFVASDALLLVAEDNVAEMSRYALEYGLGGVTGHFLLLNQIVHGLHLQQGQCLGTGFIKSKRCLFRELNRNVEWLFSNHALKLQKIIGQLR